MTMRWIPWFWWRLCSITLLRVAEGRPIWHLRAVMHVLRWWDRWLNPWYMPPGPQGGRHA